jgi:hypothetical protein
VLASRLGASLRLLTVFAATLAVGVGVGLIVSACVPKKDLDPQWLRRDAHHAAKSCSHQAG